MVSEPPASFPRVLRASEACLDEQLQDQSVEDDKPEQTDDDIDARFMACAFWREGETVSKGCSPLPNAVFSRLRWRKKVGTMQILMTGASGFVGRHLAARLKEEGHRVLALSRGTAPEGQADAVTGPADLAGIEAWNAWPEGTDVVIHLGAVIPRSTRVSETELHRANVEATGALAKRALQEGASRIIFVSTASVHGKGGGHAYRESDPLDPPNPYARSKQLAEETFWTALARRRAVGTVIRPTPVFGKGGHGPVALLAKLAALPVPLPLRDVGGRRSLISVDNLSRFIVRCLPSGAADGETFFAADEGPLNAGEIIAAIRDGQKRRRLLFRAPGNSLGAAAGIAGKSEMWDSMTRPFVVDTSHGREMLGWDGRTTAAEALRRLAADGAL